MKKTLKGFSIVEILTVITVFVLLISVANQAFFTSLKGQSKTDVSVKVKQSANYAISFMERSLHSAQSVSSCTETSIVYLDSNGNQQTFSCQNGMIYSSSNALTSSDSNVTNCVFSCLQEGGLKTVDIDITLSQTDPLARVDEKSSIQIKTKVRLRN